MDDTDEFKKSKKEKQKEREKQMQKKLEIIKQVATTLLYTVIYGVASTKVGPGLVCYVASKVGYNLDHKLE